MLKLPWEHLQEEARQISNTTYDLGCLLLELSLATANLANASSGNAGPLISAQTGFLAADGTHAHVTNRVPSPFSSPVAGVAPMPGVPMPAGMPLLSPHSLTKEELRYGVQNNRRQRRSFFASLMDSRG